MNFLQILKAKWGIRQLRSKIAKAKSDHAHEALRMEFEFKKKEQKIARLCEDNKVALKRAKEDWALESAYVSDHIDDLEGRLLGEICTLDAGAAKKALHAKNYGASDSKTLQMVNKDVA